MVLAEAHGLEASAEEVVVEETFEVCAHDVEGRRVDARVEERENVRGGLEVTHPGKVERGVVVAAQENLHVARSPTEHEEERYDQYNLGDLFSRHYLLFPAFRLTHSEGVSDGDVV